MVHQPFEEWIMEEKKLTAEQTERLQAHLRECSECRELQGSMQRLDEWLARMPMAAPLEGFTLRWQVHLARRRAMQQRRQVRKFFLLLTGAGLFTLGVMGLRLTLTSSPVELISRFVENSTRVLINLDQLQRFAATIWRSLPPYLWWGLWVVLASGLCLFTVIWFAALWRTTFQGVFNK